MDVLVGSTGLIGQVLREAHEFGACFHSKNIHEAPLLKEPIERLYLACMPAEKWKANAAPLDDFDNMNNIIQNIRHLPSPAEVIVYSTIDVHGQTAYYADGTPEIFAIDYGTNRYIFEMLVKAVFLDSVVTIIRLPALFHRLIKKNILFDLLTNNNVEKINANSAYQWYCLDDLWKDTKKAISGTTNEFYTAPIETAEIVERFFPDAKVGSGPRIEYNIPPYKYDKAKIMKKMEAFINAWN
jgi:hypothetical protein